MDNSRSKKSKAHAAIAREHEKVAITFAEAIATSDSSKRGLRQPGERSWATVELCMRFCWPTANEMETSAVLEAPGCSRIGVHHVHEDKTISVFARRS